MVGFATVAGAGDLGFPVCSSIVKSTECFASFGDGRPGFVSSWAIGDEAVWGERDVTGL